ncbi:MAG: CopG family transcriptional regulator [Propionibacteriaceae bacterium]|jgi:hypothetical protein|nr:CopG family transcriptional regulator [Propionibacteriaceae bacterium]
MTVTIGPDIDLDAETVILPSGRRYTNADADADADHFEGKRAGRPSLDSGVSPQIAFRVPPATKAKLRAVANSLGRTEASIVREALDRFLETASTSR